MCRPSIATGAGNPVNGTDYTYAGGSFARHLRDASFSVPIRRRIDA
jgi:hypothetical protein